MSTGSPSSPRCLPPCSPPWAHPPRGGGRGGAKESATPRPSHSPPRVSLSSSRKLPPGSYRTSPGRCQSRPYSASAPLSTEGSWRQDSPSRFSGPAAQVRWGLQPRRTLSVRRKHLRRLIPHQVETALETVLRQRLGSWRSACDRTSSSWSFAGLRTIATPPIPSQRLEASPVNGRVNPGPRIFFRSFAISLDTSAVLDGGYGVRNRRVRPGDGVPGGVATVPHLPKAPPRGDVPRRPAFRRRDDRDAPPATAPGMGRDAICHAGRSG